MPTQKAKQHVQSVSAKIDHVEATLKEIRNELRHLEQTFEQLMSKMQQAA